MPGGGEAGSNVSHAPSRMVYYGPAAMGYLKDLTGSYEPGLQVLPGLGALAFLVVPGVARNPRATPALATEAADQRRHGPSRPVTRQAVPPDARPSRQPGH